MRRRAVVAVVAGIGAGTVVGAASGPEDAANGELTPAAVPPVVTEAPKEPPYWRRRGCHGWHRAPVARRILYRHVHSTRPWINRRFVRRTRICVGEVGAARRLKRAVRTYLSWRKTYAAVWPIRFNRLAPWERSWAVSTSSCEAGMNPAAHNPSGIYHGAFQFLLSTWHSAGGTGDPHAHSWHYQAVIAVSWMHRSSASQWPVCGH